MATVANVATQAATAIEALGSSPTRMGSDRRTDLESIASGATKYQLRVWHASKDDQFSSNVNYDVAAIEVAIHHYLASATAERTYTEGAMLTEQDSLLAKSFWTDLDAVFGVDDQLLPGTTESPERVGNVISYTIALEVRVQP